MRPGMISGTVGCSTNFRHRGWAIAFWMPSKLMFNHRMLIRRFPFALYDVMEATSIDIYAILDCRRDPIWIRARLGATRPSP